jgi:formyl-CoA transferase
MLGDLGAKVIKIEQPNGGDDARAYAPHINGESAYYANLNRNKLGITLNLKSPEGKEIFKKMAKTADVVIENYRPGVMDRLGLGYDILKELNPRLVYAAVSGFGSYGRYSDRPGYDIISQAMGGLMSLTGPKGGEPTRSGNAMGDILGGMNLCIGILAAIHARALTGKGQKVDVSLVDSVVASLENAFTRYHDSGEIPERTGNAYASIAPYDSYRAKDGWVVVACGNQKLFEVLCNDLLKMPELIDDERFLTIPLRVINNEALKVYIEKWTVVHSVEKIVSVSLGKGVPASPIYDLAQIVNDPHIAVDREMFVEVDHPVIGRVKVNGNPVKLSETKATVRFAAPTLGQHNREIIGELGYDIAELSGKGVL